MTRLHMAALAPALALAGTSSAAVIVADYGLLPSDNQSNAGYQTFTTDDAGGEIKYLLVGGPTGGANGTAGVTAMIYEVASGGANGDATITVGALLDTSDTQDLPATADHPATAVFDFGGDVTLAPNTLYAIAFSTDGGATVGAVRVGYHGGSAYDGGDVFNADGTNAFGTAYDVAFAFSDVPEPGSLALLFGGGLMIARRRRG